MFIHDQTDKLLVAFGDPPVDITELQIEANKDLLSVEIKLTEKQFTAFNKKDIPCEKYDKGETFIQCTQKYFTNFLRGRCSVPGNVSLNFFNLSLIFWPTLQSVTMTICGKK